MTTRSLTLGVLLALVATAPRLAAVDPNFTVVANVRKALLPPR